MSIRLEAQLGATEKLRLFLSYQRYGVLLLLIGSAGVAMTVSSSRGLAQGVALWPLVGLAAGVIVAAKTLPMALYVIGQWPKKLRATRVGLHRLQQGRFRPDSLRSYCEDPCYRVVANELLRQAGHDRAERRALIRSYYRDSQQPLFIMKVDPLTQRMEVQGALLSNSPTTAAKERTRV